MPPPRERPTFWSDFKRFFLRGLAVLLPSVLTLWIVVQLFYFVDAQVAAPINRGIRAAVTSVVPQLPEWAQPDWYRVTDEELREFRESLQQLGTLEARSLAREPDTALRAEMRRVAFARFWESHWYFRFVGLVVAVVLFYLAGLIFGGIVGRAIYEQLERLLTRLPVIKQVYPHVKQLVDLVLGERQMAFRRVVLVQYPSKGIWTVAFATSAGMRDIASAAGEDMLTIFVPSTPTPFTGFTITVPRSEVIDVPLSVDEAIRFVLTGGVLVPERQGHEATLHPGAQAPPAAGTIGLGAAGGPAARPAGPAGLQSTPPADPSRGGT